MTEMKRYKHAQRTTEASAVSAMKLREILVVEDTKRIIGKTEAGTVLYEGGYSTAYLERYTNLATALTAIGSTNTNLVISRTTTLTGNTTIPENVTLEFKKGGVIALAGFTITINGDVNSPNFQVFSGVGSVAGLEKYNTKWFGTTKTATSLNAILALLPSTNSDLEIDGAWTIDENVTIPSNVLLKPANDCTFIQSATYTMTFDSPFIGDLYPYFSGNQNFIVLKKNRSCWTEWWGAVADGSVNCTQAIINAAKTESPIVYFVPGDYKCDPIFWNYANALINTSGSYDSLTGAQVAGPSLGRKHFIASVASTTNSGNYYPPYTPTTGRDMASGTGEKATRIVCSATARTDWFWKVFGAQEFKMTGINLHGKLFSDVVFWMPENCTRGEFNFCTFECSTPTYGAQLYLGDALINSQVDFHVFNNCLFANPFDQIEGTDQVTLVGDTGIKILQGNTVGNSFNNCRMVANRIHVTCNGSSNSVFNICDFSKYTEYAIYNTGLSNWRLNECYTEVQYTYGTTPSGFLYDEASFSVGGPASSIENCRIQGLYNTINLTCNKNVIVRNNRIADGTTGYVNVRAPSNLANAYQITVEGNSFDSGSDGIIDVTGYAIYKNNYIGGVLQPDRGNVYGRGVLAGILNRKYPIQISDGAFTDNESGVVSVIKNVAPDSTSINSGHAVKFDLVRSTGKAILYCTTTATAGAGENLSGNLLERFSADLTGVKITGRIQGSKGADIASANDLTLGLGNYFDITGTTQINGIAVANWTAGSEITLQFDSTPTVKHNTAGSAGFASILLAGAVDFVASADDTLTLVYDGTTWREKGRAVI